MDQRYYLRTSSFLLPLISQSCMPPIFLKFKVFILGLSPGSQGFFQILFILLPLFFSEFTRVFKSLSKGMTSGTSVRSKSYRIINKSRSMTLVASHPFFHNFFHLYRLIGTVVRSE